MWRCKEGGNRINLHVCKSASASTVIIRPGNKALTSPTTPFPYGSHVLARPKGLPSCIPTHTHYYQSTLHIIASSPLPSYVDRSKRSKGCVTRARFNPPPPRRRRAINKYIEKKISPLRSLLAPPISTLLINSGSMLRKGCCCVCIAIYFSNKRICICKALH